MIPEKRALKMLIDHLLFPSIILIIVSLTLYRLLRSMNNTSLTNQEDDRQIPIDAFDLDAMPLLEKKYVFHLMLIIAVIAFFSGRDLRISPGSKQSFKGIYLVCLIFTFLVFS